MYGVSSLGPVGLAGPPPLHSSLQMVKSPTDPMWWTTVICLASNHSLISQLWLPNVPWGTTCPRLSVHRVQIETSFFPCQHPECTCDTVTLPCPLPAGQSNQRTSFSQPLWLARGWARDPIGDESGTFGGKIRDRSTSTPLPSQVYWEIRVRAWSCWYYPATARGRSLENRVRIESHREDKKVCILSFWSVTSNWLALRIKWPLCGPISLTYFKWSKPLKVMTVT